jgi:PAS domain-containing protein
MNSSAELRGKFAEGPGILMAVIDITDLRRAEEELRIKDWSIKTTMTGIAFATPDGNLSFANNSWLRMWGYGELGEALGLHISEFMATGICPGTYSRRFGGRLRIGPI